MKDFYHFWLNTTPKVVYLQETFLKDINLLNIRNYNSYNHLRKDEQRTSGSVSMLGNAYPSARSA